MKKAIVILICSLMVFSLMEMTAADVHATEGDEFDNLRTEWFNRLTGEDLMNPDDPDIIANIDQMDKDTNTHWEEMNQSDNREYLWDDLDSETDPYAITESYVRLKEMALSYNTKGSDVYKNDRLKQDILDGLDWLYENRYNESKNPYGNWWDWEIGIPLELKNLLVLMYEDLSPSQMENYIQAIDRFVPDPTERLNGIRETGTNLLEKSLIVMVRGIVDKNEEKIIEGRDAISPIFHYVTNGDGFYRDGSFVFHSNIAYTGSYGYVLMDGLVDILILTQDSKWEITDPNLENVYEWVKESYEPLIYDGLMMDMVRGRAISRDEQQDHIIGRYMAAAFLRLSQVAPDDESAYMQSMVKSWLEQTNSTFENYYVGLDIYSTSLMKEVLTDESVISKSELTKHQQFSAMDRVIHRQPEFAFGISMSSERIANYTSINQENLKAWYTGQGMTFLYNDDLTQYNDNFWPNIDPYRLPGTTSDGQTRKASTGQSWVGGSSINDLYGTAGMELDPNIQTMDGEQSTLEGKKSWFMFDDEIVALGSGINSQSGTTVETIVENRKINEDGDNTLTVNGEGQSSNLSWSETMESVQWAHLEGNTANSDIGYYFPEEPDVEGKRESRTNAWSEINQLPEYATYEPSTRNFLSLSINHGENPEDDSYSYVLLPNKSEEETKQYSEQSDIEILHNTENVQAVTEKNLGITAANFWREGAAGFISSDNPSSIMVEDDDNQMRLAVSDPTQKQNKITVQLDKIATSIVNSDDTVHVINTAPLVVEVDTRESQGETHSITFEYEPLSASGMKNLVEQYDVEGGFATEEAVQHLQTHLTSVSYYEEQEETDKVIQHMRGFKHLLNHQLNNELITKDVYENLAMQADALISKLQ